LKNYTVNIFYYFLLLTYSSFAQEKYNYVAIDKNDTQREIIRKAANVVPSERQLRWQKMELIAFIHFNMNTFTGKKWGDGTEDPKLFNNN
jgi:alpha-L-fucosidase